MKSSLFAFFISLFVVEPAWADTTISILTDQAPLTIFVKDQKVRIIGNNSLGQSAGEVIFSEQDQSLTIVDHENQSLFVLDAQSIDTIGGTLNSAVGVIQQQMENLSAAQRSGVLDMFRGFGLSIAEQAKPELQLESVVERSYKGIKCVEHQLMEASTEIALICVSQENSLNIDDADYASLLAAQSFALNAASQASRLAEQYGQKIPNFKGLLLNGLLVHSVQKEPYDASAKQAIKASFSIDHISTAKLNNIVTPQGYQRRSLPF
jgi:hypothetical protein